MSGPAVLVRFAGPHVTVQDGGRPGLARYGVPTSGAMDRVAHAAANLALGRAAHAPAIEVSLGGLQLECLQGPLPYAVTGGGFVVEHNGQKRGSWHRSCLQTGDRLILRPGPWGTWCYLAFAADIERPAWLGSLSTHASSGLGGGKITTGDRLTFDAPEAPRPDRLLACPTFARPRHLLRTTLGPQDRFFSQEQIALLTESLWRLSPAYDRMGVRLAGPSLAPEARLDMPSEPVARGAIQVAGDGVATLLLADHQTTGGYPKIATALDADLDRFTQMRPQDPFRIALVSPDQAIAIARQEARSRARWFETLSAP